MPKDRRERYREKRDWACALDLPHVVAPDAANDLRPQAHVLVKRRDSAFGKTSKSELWSLRNRLVAALVVGDIIIKIDDRVMATHEMVPGYLGTLTPETKVQVHLMRVGKELVIPVTLGTRPKPPEAKK